MTTAFSTSYVISNTQPEAYRAKVREETRLILDRLRSIFVANIDLSASSKAYIQPTFVGLQLPCVNPQMPMRSRLSSTFQSVRVDQEFDLLPLPLALKLRFLIRAVW